MKKVEFFIKQILLKLLLLINPVKRKEHLPAFNSDSKLLFIRLNRIGDALVTTPLLHELKDRIGCKIFVLADKNNHFVFRNNPAIDEVIVYEKGMKGFLNFNTILKSKSIDVIIDLHDDVSATVSFLVALSKVKYKFGLRRSNYKLFTHTVERLESSQNHIIIRILKLSELFGLTINPDSVSVRYYVLNDVQEIASGQIKKINPYRKFLVGINISAGSKARFWGVDNFKKLISALSFYEIKIIVFCTDSDYSFAKLITDDMSIYPPTKDFGNFAAAILNLDFLITPDTSIVHIASINRIPMFGIYVKYNTKDMIWTPFNTDYDCVITEEPNFNNITFEEVKNKLIPFLEKHLNAKTNS